MAATLSDWFRRTLDLTRGSVVRVSLARFVLLSALALLVLIPVCGGAWFARQNHFEWMFNPLKQPEYVDAAKASFVHNDDIVMAVNIKGTAVAYPILQLGYHHIVNDVVSGEPIVATY